MAVAAAAAVGSEVADSAVATEVGSVVGVVGSEEEEEAGSVEVVVEASEAAETTLAVDAAVDSAAEGGSGTQLYLDDIRQLLKLIAEGAAAVSGTKAEEASAATRMDLEAPQMDQAGLVGMADLAVGLVVLLAADLGDTGRLGEAMEAAVGIVATSNAKVVLADTTTGNRNVLAIRGARSQRCEG